MKTIALIAQKGGGGKTTLAECLAVAATLDRKSAAILDIDPQATAASWKDRRGDDDPAVIPITPPRIPDKLAVAREAGADFVFIDTPARLSDAALEAAKNADLVIIPARTTIKDLERVEASLQLIKVVGSRPIFVVLTQVRAQGDRHAQAAAAIEKLAVPVCPAQIGFRVAYEDADTMGRTPQETEPDGKAAQEIEAVYRFTIKTINRLTNGTNRHEEDEPARCAG